MYLCKTPETTSHHKTKFMRQVLFFLCMFPLLAFAQYKLGSYFLEYKTAAPSGFTYENLRLYPIIAKDSFKLAFKDLGRFTTLKDALATNKIKITETGSSGVVNTLQVENTSNDTIILNCGEVIKGGKQDRVIESDMVLYPKSGKKKLPVFCVEQGRWSPDSRADGKSFTGYYNFSSAGLRKVVAKDKQQGAVWSKVSEINSANQTVNSTDAYTRLEESKDYKAKTEKYVTYFNNKIHGLKDVVGVIAVTGSKVIAVDVFATNDLFKKNFEGLIYSYTSEAIIHGKIVSITQAQVDNYMNELLDEKKHEEVIKKKGSKLDAGNKRLKISSFE